MLARGDDGGEHGNGVGLHGNRIGVRGEVAIRADARALTRPGGKRRQARGVIRHHRGEAEEESGTGADEVQGEENDGEDRRMRDRAGRGDVKGLNARVEGEGRRGRWRQQNVQMPGCVV